MPLWVKVGVYTKDPPMLRPIEGEKEENLNKFNWHFCKVFNAWLFEENWIKRDLESVKFPNIQKTLIWSNI